MQIRLFLELVKLCHGIEGQNIDYGMLRDSDIPLPQEEQTRLSVILTARKPKSINISKIKEAG